MRKPTPRWLSCPRGVGRVALGNAVWAPRVCQCSTISTSCAGLCFLGKPPADSFRCSRVCAARGLESARASCRFQDQCRRRRSGAPRCTHALGLGRHLSGHVGPTPGSRYIVNHWARERSVPMWLVIPDALRLRAIRSGRKADGATLYLSGEIGSVDSGSAAELGIELELDVFGAATLGGLHCHRHWVRSQKQLAVCWCGRSSGKYGTGCGVAVVGRGDMVAFLGVDQLGVWMRTRCPRGRHVDGLLLPSRHSCRAS
jgi:hypothetical protein